LPYEKKDYLAAAVVSTAAAAAVSTAVVSTATAVVSTATAVVSAAGASEEPPHDARATIAKIAKNFFILLGF
jgi:hypothetical protein